MDHRTETSPEPEAQKRRAAAEAVKWVESGMCLGLGSGSTATHAIAEIGARLAAGRLSDIRGVPTSRTSAAQAASLGIPLVDLGPDGVDLAIDGMDELDPALNAIKGLGGALAREKIVAARARRFILIGDESKRVAHLGEKAPVPVEVLRFGWRAAQVDLQALGCEAVLRADPGTGQTFVSDNGNYVLDCRFDQDFDAPALAEAIDHVVGTVEHGLFLNMADLAYVAAGTSVLELAP